MQNLNGYRATHRNKWYFIQHSILSVQELALLEFYADLFCFNPTQPNFGTFTVKFEEVANVFNCKSDTTIRNWHRRLLELGFIEKTSTASVFKLVCCARYIGPGFFKGEAVKYQEREKNQSIEIILQSFGIDFQSIGTNIQPIEIQDDEKADVTAQTTSLAKDSYNDIDTVASLEAQRFVVIRQAVRSDTEYQEFYSDCGFEKLTPEDMRWIDENTLEKISIETEEREKEIVKMYFNGSWDKYLKNVDTKTGVSKRHEDYTKYSNRQALEANVLDTTAKTNRTTIGPHYPAHDQKDGCASNSSSLENQPRKNSIGSDSKIDGHRAV